jgi:hypothetical protein
MTHPDPNYRKIAMVSRFWIRLVVGKLSLFAGAFLFLIAGSELQKQEMPGDLGSYALIIAAIASMVGAFTWNFWPRKACPQCGTIMRGRNIRPKNQKGRVMILCCHTCKLFIDLGVSSD